MGGSRSSYWQRHGKLCVLTLHCCLVVGRTSRAVIESWFGYIVLLTLCCSYPQLLLLVAEPARATAGAECSCLQRRDSRQLVRGHLLGQVNRRFQVERALQSSTTMCLFSATRCKTTGSSERDVRSARRRCNYSRQSAVRSCLQPGYVDGWERLGFS